MKEIKLKETKTELHVEVSLPTRDLATDPKCGFSCEDAIDFLKQQNKEFDSILEGRKMILDNHGSLHGPTGTYKFLKVKPKAPPKKSTPTRTTTRTKTTRQKKA